MAMRLQERIAPVKITHRLAAHPPVGIGCVPGPPQGSGHTDRAVVERQP